jgi:hypothetical protein
MNITHAFGRFAFGSLRLSSQSGLCSRRSLVLLFATTLLASQAMFAQNGQNVLEAVSEVVPLVHVKTSLPTNGVLSFIVAEATHVPVPWTYWINYFCGGR